MARLVGLTVLAAAASGCSSDLDCYGGACKAGACECPPLWGGPNCEILRLKPANRSAPGVLLVNGSTWGGGAVQDTDGIWHMHAARMEGKCGLTSWATNSEIAHFTAASPEGPYTPAPNSPILRSFAHGPKPILLPNGGVAMPHLGCGDGTAPFTSGCVNGSTPGTPASRGGSHCNRPGWAGLLVAAEPSFSSPMQVMDVNGSGLSVDGGEGAWHQPAGLTNPAVWFVNGSNTMLLAYSTGCTKCPMDPGHKHVGLAYGTFSGASSAPPVFTDLTPSAPIFPWACEDPYVFQDPDSGYWHIIGHRTGNDSHPLADVSAHAVAPTWKGPWLITPTQPYSRHIEWTGGGAAWVQKRERPHLIWTRAGRPVALANGVMPGDNATPVSPGRTGDWSYTHVQLLDPK